MDEPYRMNQEIDDLRALVQHPGWALLKEHVLEEMVQASAQVHALSPLTQAEALIRMQQRCMDLNEVVDYPAQRILALGEEIDTLSGAG